MTDPDPGPDQPRRECTCTPPPSCEGPCAWCDVHGLPSVAFEQGLRQGEHGADVVHALEVREKDAELAKLRADIAYRQDEKEIQLHIQDEYSAALRVMAARLTRERRESASARRAAEFAASYQAATIARLRGDRDELQVERATLRADLAAARTAQESALDAAQQAAEALVDQGRVMERMNAEMRRMDAENAELRTDRDRWKDLTEGWYREHNKALDDRDAARATLRSQAERADTPAAGEVQWEWGWVHPQDEDTAVMGGYSEEVARERAVRDAGTLYRRTVTTTPWVEVPDAS